MGVYEVLRVDDETANLTQHSRAPASPSDEAGERMTLATGRAGKALPGDTGIAEVLKGYGV